MALFANLRPAICYPALAEASSLKRELVDGLDILILRELTGGVYFGSPKEIIDLGEGQKRGIDTQVYETYEIERIARAAFEAARTRHGKVTSMEKRNVMKTGVLWNEVVSRIGRDEYPDVRLEHMLADAGGMQLVRSPKQFDVIVTDNLFGDMLSDIAAMLTGSLGMLPSASLGAPDAATGKRRALTSRCTARHRTSRARHRQPDRDDRLVRDDAALLLRADAGSRRAGSFDRGGSGIGHAHRRHHGAGCRQVGTAEMGDAVAASSSAASRPDPFDHPKKKGPRHRCRGPFHVGRPRQSARSTPFFSRTKRRPIATVSSAKITGYQSPAKISPVEATIANEVAGRRPPNQPLPMW